MNQCLKKNSNITDDSISQEKQQFIQPAQNTSEKTEK